MKRWSIIGGAMVLSALFAFATLAPAGPASANGGGKPGREPGGGTHGRFPFDSIPGVLDANGDGILAAAGMLNLRMCADEGLLLVKKGGSTIAGGTSTDEVDWLGLRVYFGFSGCVDITGGDAAALLVGKGLTLHAEGVGVAFLKGTGSYTNDGVTHEGSTEGVIVKIGSKLFAKPTKTPRPSTPKATHTPGAEHTATATATAGP